MKQALTYLGLAFFAMVCCFQSKAQETTRILFVFDASNSMSAFWENEPKMNTAVRLLSASVDDLAGTPDLETALRVYGHQTRYVPGKQDCDDTELVVPFSHENNLIIKKALQRIRPMGTTPIARSLEKAADDFPECSDCRNIIILITDGLEACDEDPCAASAALQAKGIVLRPFVIGIGGAAEFLSVFECVGKYYDASKEENFKKVLDVVISQALNNTTVQVNLLDAKGAPTITNVPMSFYNQRTGAAIHHFVHAVDRNGNPDTLALDPVTDYRLKVHTIPPLQKENIQLTAGKHNTIDLKAGQGSLQLSFPRGRNEYNKLSCIVRKKGSCEIVHLQDFEEIEHYLAGEYEIEINTIPPTVIPDVVITENEETSIQIPTPGVLTLIATKSGYGGIFLRKDEELIKVHSFDGDRPSGRYRLQPGQYTLVFRGEREQETLYTIDKPFEIKSGQPITLQL